MKFKITAIVLALLFILAACGQSEPEKPSFEVTADKSMSITVSGDGIDGEKTFTLGDMLEKWGADGGVYSTINNWPTKAFAVAKGIRVEDILKEVGVYDTFKTITFTAVDGYYVTFTRDQFVEDRFMYPGLNEDKEDDAVKMPTLLTFSYKSGTENMDDTADCDFMLVFGQANVFEHNTVSYVEKLASITVSNEEPEQWEPPFLYPDYESFAAGDTVRLQHNSFGLVKIFYTTDGSDPTVRSTMYNPSTYQPDLNGPITLDKDVQIKAFVSAYGKKDSEVVTFDVKVK